MSLEDAQRSLDSEESITFIVSGSPLWVLPPEISLVVTQEERNLHPSFLGVCF